MSKPNRWYAVCDSLCTYDEGSERDAAKVWTVSRDPHVPGWETDAGCPGYGLTRKDAEFLARALRGTLNLRTQFAFDALVVAASSVPLHIPVTVTATQGVPGGSW